MEREREKKALRAKRQRNIGPFCPIDDTAAHSSSICLCFSSPSVVNPAKLIQDDETAERLTVSRGARL